MEVWRSTESCVSHSLSVSFYFSFLLSSFRFHLFQSSVTRILHDCFFPLFFLLLPRRNRSCNEHDNVTRHDTTRHDVTRCNATPPTRRNEPQIIEGTRWFFFFFFFKDETSDYHVKHEIPRVLYLVCVLMMVYSERQIVTFCPGGCKIIFCQRIKFRTQLLFSSTDSYLWILQTWSINASARSAIWRWY